jgi:glucose/arabinose dehydrogenase
MKNLKMLIAIFLLNFSISFSMISEDELITREVRGNLKTIWEVLWGLDNYLWITERYGRISRINPETGELHELITIPDVYEIGECGLMGMALHPDLLNEPYIYVVYNHLDNIKIKIKIVRYKYTGTSLVEPKVLLDDIAGNWNHNGARIYVDNDLKIWFTIGDAGIESNAQSLVNLNGKISRMNIDGSIPTDNPFQNSMIWSFGHRNQQGLIFHNDKIYTSEHGAAIDDEINLIQKGRNYGWPKVQGFCNTEQEKIFCTENNVVEPILSLTPQSTYAISGIDLYTNNLINDWENSILITSLKNERIIVAKLNDEGDNIISTNEYFIRKFGRIRDVCISPDGKVYIATSNQDGRASGQFANVMDKIIEIKPKGLSVIENETNQQIIISPNPSNSMFEIHLGDDFENIISVEIYDILGKSIQKFNEINGNILYWNGRDDFGSDCMSGKYRILINSKYSITSAILVLVR